MERRTFLTGLFGVAVGAAALAASTRAEAFTGAVAPAPEPKAPDVPAKEGGELASKLPETVEIEKVAWRRRYYRRRPWRRRKVCRTVWRRRRRVRTCYYC